MVDAPRSRTALCLCSILVAAALLAGCTKAEPKPTNATTSNATSGANAATTATTPASSPSATPTPTQTTPASFNGTCDDLLPVTNVENAIGRPLVGRTLFIVGIPEANIGRIAYLNCKYGITALRGKKGTVTTTKLEIGVSLYGTAQQASSRLSGTIDDYRGNGATSTSVAIGPVAGTILLGYGAPTLVASVGPRTVAVTIAPTFLPPAARNKALVDAANIALTATATFNQGGAAPSATATPGASSSAS